MAPCCPKGTLQGYLANGSELDLGVPAAAPRAGNGFKRLRLSQNAHLLLLGWELDHTPPHVGPTKHGEHLALDPKVGTAHVPLLICLWQAESGLSETTGVMAHPPGDCGYHALKYASSRCPSRPTILHSTLCSCARLGRRATPSLGSGPWSTAPSRRSCSTRRWSPSSKCPRPTSKRKPGASFGRSNAAASAIWVAAL